MLIETIQLRRKIYSGLTLILVAVFILISPNFKLGEPLLQGSWWILSFNILLLLTLAVGKFRREIKSNDQLTQKVISYEINGRLKGEIYEKDLKKKFKIHEDIADIFYTHKMFPKNRFIQFIIKSFLASVGYILIYFTFSSYINEKIVFDLLLVNVALSSLFLISFYYFIKCVIEIAYFFKTDD